jgi:hypothetical protein
MIEKHFKVGDIVALGEGVYLRAFDVTVPAGELAMIVDVDPESPDDLLLKLRRTFDRLWPWKNHIPATATAVTLRLRAV